jgi:hypothetical protein
MSHSGIRWERIIDGLSCRDEVHEFVDLQDFPGAMGLSLGGHRTDLPVFDGKGASLRSIDVELNAVAVRIPEVGGHGHEVIGGKMAVFHRVKPGEDSG